MNGPGCFICLCVVAARFWRSVFVGCPVRTAPSCRPSEKKLFVRISTCLTDRPCLENLNRKGGERHKSAFFFVTHTYHTWFFLSFFLSALCRLWRCYLLSPRPKCLCSIARATTGIAVHVPGDGDLVRHDGVLAGPDEPRLGDVPRALHHPSLAGACIWATRSFILAVYCSPIGRLGRNFELNFKAVWNVVFVLHYGS